MCADIVVLSFAHLHFILQHFRHRSNAFPVTVGSDCVHIFGKQVVILLFLKVTLIVHQVVHSIQILSLQILPGIFPCQPFVPLYRSSPSLFYRFYPVRRKSEYARLAPLHRNETIDWTDRSGTNDNLYPYMRHIASCLSD